MKIGLISDTHSFMDDNILSYIADCDSIWHAGDIGSKSVMEKLEKLGKPIYAVHGNIDHGEVRNHYPKDLSIEIEGYKIFMTHIGGYPGRYNKRVKEILERSNYDLYICGHSHICKVMRDKNLNLLHMNPGACGHHGFHKIRTILRFELRNKEIKKLEVIELGRRGC